MQNDIWFKSSMSQQKSVYNIIGIIGRVNGLEMVNESTFVGMLTITMVSSNENLSALLAGL